MKRLLFAVAAIAMGVSAAFGLSRIGAERAVSDLASRLERDAGLSVDISGADVSFFPYPAVTTGRLVLSNGEEVLLRARSARLDVSLARLLIGQASYERLVLEEPAFTLGAQGTTAPRGVERLIAALTGLESVVARGGSLQIAGREPIAIRRASAEVSGERIDATAEIELHKLQMGITSQLKRQSAPATPPWQISAEATSPLFNLKITGTAGSAFASFEGKTHLVTPSLRSFLSFLGHPMPAGPGFDVVQMETVASYVPGNLLNLKDLKLKLDGNQATGALQVNLTDRSSIHGTLAFDTVDLSPYTAGSSATFASFISDLNLWRENWRADLRLSAAKVKVAGMEGNFAGSLVINEDLAELAVGSTTLGASELSGRLALTSPPRHEPSYEMSLNARAMNAAMLARLLPAPLGLSGTLNTGIVATARGSSLKTARQTLAGEMNVEATALAVQGLDVTRPIERLVEGRAYVGWPIERAAAAGLEALQAKARFADGHLSVEKGTARVGGWQIALKGEAGMAEQAMLDFELAITSPGTENTVAAELVGERSYPVWRQKRNAREAELGPSQ